MWIPKHLEFKYLYIKVYEIYKSLDICSFIYKHKYLPPEVNVRRGGGDKGKEAFLHFPSCVRISYPRTYELGFPKAHYVDTTQAATAPFPTRFPLEAWVTAGLCHPKTVSPTQVSCEKRLARRSGSFPTAAGFRNGSCSEVRAWFYAEPCFFCHNAENGNIRVTIIKQTVFHVLSELLPSFQEMITCLKSMKKMRGFYKSYK